MLKNRFWLRIFTIGCLVSISIGAVLVLLREASNSRDWTQDQEVLSEISLSETVNGTQISIKNIRDTTYSSRDEYEVSYYDSVFNINDLISVDLFVEELFSVAVAHTFLSFGFSDGSYLVVSTEIRKEEWEEFSPFKGFFREYEIMYVIASEEDILKVRGIHRDNPIYRYELQLTDTQKQDLFISILKEAELLSKTPEFYNTFFNSCNQLIMKHISSIGIKIPFDYRIFLPKNTGAFLYRIGLIDTNKDFSDIHENAFITSKIQKAEFEENFSEYIRGNID